MLTHEIVARDDPNYPVLIKKPTSSIRPAAAVLLFLCPNLGVVATAVIIIADVLHNLWITARYVPPLLHGISASPAMLEQLIFMIFVLASAHSAWRPDRSSKP